MARQKRQTRPEVIHDKLKQWVTNTRSNRIAQSIYKQTRYKLWLYEYLELQKQYKGWLAYNRALRLSPKPAEEQEKSSKDIDLQGNGQHLEY